MPPVPPPKVAEALRHLEVGASAALVVELDERTRDADAFDDVRAVAGDLGFATVSVAAVETDEVSSRSRLLEELATIATSALHEDGLQSDRTAEMLEALSRSRPVVVIIEDLRWTDPVTLQSLRTLPEPLRHLPICWVVGVSPGSRRGDRVLSVLRRLKTYTLPRHDPTDQRVVASMPLAFLQVAAVVGVEFDLDVVARVLERTVGSLLGEVDDALQSGVLADAGPRLRFADPSLRTDIYAGLSDPVRRALHHDVARELRRPGSESDAVWHLIRSTRHLSEDELALIRAAIARLSPVAPEDAAELALRVSRLFDPYDPHHIEFVTSAARDLGNTSRVGEALALVEQRRTAGLSDQDEARLRLVAAHLHQAAGDDADAMDHVDRALALPGTDDQLRIALLKTRAVGHVNLGEVDAATRLSEVLAESIELSDDPAVELSAGLFRSQLAFSKGQVSTALELAERAAHSFEVSAARPLPAPRIPELWLATVMLSSDRASEASELLLAGQRQAERRGFVWSVPYWHTVRAIERWLLEELDDAAAEAETAIHVADALEIARYVPMSRSVLSIVEADRGNVSRARRLMADATLPARPRTYDIWTAAALIRLGGSEAQAGRPWLHRYANTARIMSLPPRLWPMLVADGPESGPLRRAFDEIAHVASDQAVVVEALKATTRQQAHRPQARGAGGAPATGWDSLTASELRVASLVVAGHTNRAIASLLQVSIHTVGTHLRHVFTKLDINTRVELTRLALQRNETGRGLLEE
ncbi:LuxR family transcriptional regulator [Nocardioides humi]|uniref:HTH luxR-type domain-containing protein n=1 Tax=Nocardioides humi TaxID=449461 RepID=A0ABN2BTM5_9ACTN|nr:LuxR family transcriptional regulator [Nocardioides humi]